MIALYWQKSNMFTNNLEILSVLITTILINLNTGICLFNTLTNHTYDLIVNLIVTYLQVYMLACNRQTTSHLLSVNELTRAPIK